jgi:nuclear receptor subfamily 2 group E protein 3
MQLPFQVILLEEAWAELFLLNAVQWCMPLESSPLFSVSDHASGVPNGKDSQVAADIRILNDTLLRFKAIGVDPAEFACLKAIVLFRSGEVIFIYGFFNYTICNSVSMTSDGRVISEK